MKMIVLSAQNRQNVKNIANGYGKRIPLGSKFCIRCGNDLEKYKCHKCGYENKKGTKFCIKCGNAL